VLTDGQRLALDHLSAMAETGDAIEVVAVTEPAATGETLTVEITMRCGFGHHPTGVAIRARERFSIEIQEGFPFTYPTVTVSHLRWAGTPHVQWGRQLCLYQTASEWEPSDGMFGFVNRLLLWLERAAAGELDPIGGPLHPPAIYGYDLSLPLIIARADTPPVTGVWLGLAAMNVVSPRRIDIVGWTPVDANPPYPQPAALAVLLPKPLSWEYPTRLRDLLDELDRQGVDRGLFFALLRWAAFQAEEDNGVYVVVGSPMRRGHKGEPQQHLAVWHLDADFARRVHQTLPKPSDSEELAAIRSELEQLLVEIADLSKIAYCFVDDARPQVTLRRDDGSPMAFFRDKAIVIWGCGALGGWIAEMLVRAGVARLLLVDNDLVSPGVLVRQPYGEADIGRSKAHCLRDRLRQIDPKVAIQSDHRDVLTDVLERQDWELGADVVMDATASPAVAAKVERVRRERGNVVPLVSMMVGHTAERGLVAISRPDAHCGTADVVQKAKLACANRAELVEFRDEFFPEEPRHEIFQPEPGCSDATFRGSAAEAMALAATMLQATARELGASKPDSVVAWMAALPSADHRGRREARLTWPGDVTVEDGLGDYEIRIARPAFAEILAWTRRTRRLRGDQVETGGLLFGRRDDATGVITISEVTGPPPDSVESATEFVCGVEGNDASIAEKRSRAGGSLAFIGMWHTHPKGSSQPSARDITSMTALVLRDDPPIQKSLALIVGGTPEESEIGAYVFDRTQYQAPVTTLRIHNRPTRPSPTSPPTRNVGLALSGGGSRAIAFHLGCLRALHDRGVLDRLRVLSCVSGGSVMGAAWAYSDGTFAEFDERVVVLLRGGLFRGTARRFVLGAPGLKAAGTMATSGVVAAGCRLIGFSGKLLARVPGVPESVASCGQINPPLRRFASVTDSLEATLRSQLFADRELRAARRDGVDVVLNACELRSGTAFRFGSRETSSSRFGLAQDDIEIAEAVCASAAYPLVLPALDRKWRFLRGGAVQEHRVVLTDGGVYDNLGTTCLEPGRSPDFTYNIFPVDYIVACDAGHGVWSGTTVPYFSTSRVRRSFDAVFRKAQDSARGRLFTLRESGQLAGFVVPYLGNQDSRLPVQPPDLVRREEVGDYPTNFSAMSQRNIDRIALRGEQLTRLFIDRWCPEL
jgi:integrative and conjugative element protein (TIGR02256 family)